VDKRRYSKRFNLPIPLRYIEGLGGETVAD